MTDEQGLKFKVFLKGNWVYFRFRNVVNGMITNDSGDKFCVDCDDENHCVEVVNERFGTRKVEDCLKEMTDDERLELFNKYCKHCGGNNPRCQCWNDE